jgi:glycosyltransferase involved in cell wall biosynthesis
VRQIASQQGSPGQVSDSDFGMLSRELSNHGRVAESDICMVGVFPPPVHGMAMLNNCMYEHLSTRGAAPVVLDLAPASLKRTWFNRLARIRKVAKAFVLYGWEILSGRGGTLYVALSGGWGQLYETLFVAVARLRGARIFLHHHSFAYVDRGKMHARLLVRLAGPAATHVVGCDRQWQKLRQRYPTAAVTRTVSNPAIIWRNADARYRQRTCVRKIGFLSNISREKGIMECIVVAEQLERRGSGLEVYIAGPFESPTVEREVQAAVERLHSLHYMGARYGSEKESFWQMIDVLIFPSKYSNETAPVVVLEAIGHGVPVVAWERGCLATMVPPTSGLLVDRDHDFVAAAVDRLIGWQRDSAGFAEISKAAAKEFVRQHVESRVCLEALLNELCPSTQAPTLSSPHRAAHA